jgi:NTE family protein
VAQPFGPPRSDSSAPAADEERTAADAAEQARRKDGIDAFLDSLQRFFGREPDAPGGEAGSTLEELASSAQSSPTRLALTDVMLGMFTTMQDTLARHQLAGNPPDLLIDIPSNICQSHEFHKARELILAGEYWARRALRDQRRNGDD